MKHDDADPHNMRLWALKSSAARHRGLTEVDVLFFHFGFRFWGPGTSYISHVCCLNPWSLRKKNSKIFTHITIDYGLWDAFKISHQASRQFCPKASVCMFNKPDVSWVL